MTLFFENTCFFAKDVVFFKNTTFELLDHNSELNQKQLMRLT